MTPTLTPTWNCWWTVPPSPRAAYISGFTSAENFAHRLSVVDASSREAGRPTPLPAAAMIDCWPGIAGQTVLDAAWAATDIYRAWHAGSDTADTPLVMPRHERG